MENLDSKITPIILAGGLGTRLRPILNDMPKVLAPVNSRPFISYLLDQLITAGFQDVILCIGYKGEMVKETFGSHYKGLNICYSHEPEPLGTGGALRYALPMIASRIVLVMNGDSYIDADISAFIDWYSQRRHDAAILLTKVENTSRYGRVKINEEGQILRFDEKLEGLGPGWINAGMYLITTSSLALIPDGKGVSLEKQFFPNLVSKKRLYGYHCGEEFIDIGTPEAYTVATRKMKCVKY